MSRLIVIIFILTTLLQIQAFENIHRDERYSDPYHFMSYNASTVAIGLHLLTVSNNQMQINITSTDENFKVCHITLKEKFTEGISGAALGDQILIWGTTKRQTIGVFRHLEYTVLYFDPVQCTYKALPILEDVLLLSQSEFPPVVLTFKDSFEIFFPSQTYCYPCRFDANGNKFELRNQIRPVTGVFQRFYFQAIEQPGKNRMYQYVLQYTGTSVTRMLNHDFQITSVYGLGNKDVVALTSEAYAPYIGILSLGSGAPKPPTYFLQSANQSSVRYVYNIPVPLTKDHVIQTAFVSIDSMVNSYLTIIESVEVDTGRNVILLRYDAKGKLVSKVDFGMLEDRKIYDVQAMLINDNKYCLVIHEMNDAIPGTTDITCYSISYMD